VIELTRLNNSPLVVNSDLVKFIENTPDTVLTLTTGEKVVVAEPCSVVIAKVVEFRQKLFAGFCCQAVTTGHGSAARNMSPANESIEE
jgi:uncharacterized protein YlzI (FlbEa/FlbD family)